MYENRISGYEMGLGDDEHRPTSQPAPAHMALVRSMHAPAPWPMHVGIADLYQAAINRAVQDHELDKLFNPDFYDYQI